MRHAIFALLLVGCSTLPTGPSPVSSRPALTAWPSFAPAGSIIKLTFDPKTVAVGDGWTLTWDWNGDGQSDTVSTQSLILWVTVPQPLVFQPRALLTMADGTTYEARSGPVTIW